MITDKEIDLSHIINSAISMELRVDNAEVEKMVRVMETLGFTPKNSWDSLHRPNHKVINFWKNEFIKSDN